MAFDQIIEESKYHKRGEDAGINRNGLWSEDTLSVQKKRSLRKFKGEQASGGEIRVKIMTQEKEEPSNWNLVFLQPTKRPC